MDFACLPSRAAYTEPQLYDPGLEAGHLAAELAVEDRLTMYLCTSEQLHTNKRRVSTPSICHDANHTLS